MASYSACAVYAALEKARDSGIWQVKINAQVLVENVAKVYSLPNIYYQIDHAINTPGSTATTIGDIIAEDSGLTARLLKLANSSLFGFSSTIDTISRAVTVIGTRQLRDLALATSVTDLFKGIPAEKVNMKSFWRHSVASGICARVIASFLKQPNIESYFVAGLLHDIGSVVLFSEHPELSSKLLSAANKDQMELHVTEHRVLNFDHAMIGGMLLRHWKLPPGLIDAVSFHHSPHRANTLPTQACVVHVADIISHAMELGDNGEKYIPSFENDAWNKLDLSVNVLKNLVADVDKQLDETVTNITGS